MPRIAQQALTLARPLARPLGWLVRDLGPWVVQATVGWLIDRARRLPIDPQYRPLCRDCPFGPGGASVVAPRPTRPPSPPTKSVSSLAPAPVRLAICSALLTGLALTCGGCGVNDAYLAADRATFEAIAPEYRGYVQTDVALTPNQQARRLRTIDAWQLRLDRASDTAVSASQTSPE